MVLTAMGAFSNLLQRRNKVQCGEAVTGQIQPPNKLQFSKCNLLLGHTFLQMCLPSEHKTLASQETGHCKGPGMVKEEFSPKSAKQDCLAFYCSSFAIS